MGNILDTKYQSVEVIVLLHFNMLLDYQAPKCFSIIVLVGNAHYFDHDYNVNDECTSNSCENYMKFARLQRELAVDQCQMFRYSWSEWKDSIFHLIAILS